MDAAWPGTAVEEGNLTAQIATLRKALVPADNGGEWIATVPRVGYRFTGTVEPVASASRRAIPPSGKPSIAVLPFANLSGDQDQQYLSDGITEDIITELARFRSLLVIARNSSFQFRYPALDIAEVHRKLGVRYLVEGSIRRLGDRIRITTQLIDATTGTHLWAPTVRQGPRRHLRIARRGCGSHRLDGRRPGGRRFDEQDQTQASGRLGCIRVLPAGARTVLPV
ncbi:MULTISPECIES: hypothetical protein [unclassified Mesorhizobium]|uniref:hypothetical protein n=1 Tax=unclassified Mesorhizobium TaxID=325217 RepID=UPI00333DAA20